MQIVLYATVDDGVRTTTTTIARTLSAYWIFNGPSYLHAQISGGIAFGGHGHKHERRFREQDSYVAIGRCTFVDSLLTVHVLLLVITPRNTHFSYFYHKLAINLLVITEVTRGAQKAQTQNQSISNNNRGCTAWLVPYRTTEGGVGNGCPLAVQIHIPAYSNERRRHEHSYFSSSHFSMTIPPFPSLPCYRRPTTGTRSKARYSNK